MDQDTTIAGIIGGVVTAIVAPLGRIAIIKVTAAYKEHAERAKTADTTQREVWHDSLQIRQEFRADIKAAQDRIEQLRAEVDEEREHSAALEVEHAKAAADAKVQIALRDMRIRELETEVARFQRRGFAVPPATRLHGCKVLIVEDDLSVSSVIAALLEGEGAVVVEAANVAEARKLLGDLTFDIALIDLVLPDERGAVLAKEIAGKLPVFVMSGYGADYATDEAKGCGAQSFFAKPPNVEELVARIAAATGRG